MAQLTPRFFGRPRRREYTERHYLPAAMRYRARAAEQGAGAARLVAWRAAIERHWAALRFGEVRVTSAPGRHDFEAQVFLGGLDPDAVQVQLYADAWSGGGPQCQAMERAQAQSPDQGFCAYRARVIAQRRAADFTARVVPHWEGAQVPLEAPYILWQR